MLNSPSKLPTVQPISWIAVVPQAIALLSGVTVGYVVTGTLDGAMLGCCVYLVYSHGSRILICRAHRTGMQFMRAGCYEQAISCFEASYEFFRRHDWIDRYRSIVLMTPAALCYREMALANIAFAYGQLGQGDKCKQWYLRTYEEFPGNSLAEVALTMIDSFENGGKNNLPTDTE